MIHLQKQRQVKGMQCLQQCWVYRPSWNCFSFKCRLISPVLWFYTETVQSWLPVTTIFLSYPPLRIELKQYVRNFHIQVMLSLFICAKHSHFLSDGNESIQDHPLVQKVLSRGFPVSMLEIFTVASMPASAVCLQQSIHQSWIQSQTLNQRVEEFKQHRTDNRSISLDEHFHLMCVPMFSIVLMIIYLPTNGSHGRVVAPVLDIVCICIW